MSLNALRQGQHIKIGTGEFLILQKLPTTDGSCKTAKLASGVHNLKTNFSIGLRRVMVFIDAQRACRGLPTEGRPRSLAYPPELVAIARTREQYMKEIDRLQPIAITRTTWNRSYIPYRSESRTRSHLAGARSPGTTASGCVGPRYSRHYLAALRSRQGRPRDRFQSVKTAADEVIDELYMTEERKRVPEVHLEIVRRLSDANRFRPESCHFRFQAEGRSTVRLNGDRHTN